MVYLVFYIANGKQNLNDLAKPILNTMFEAGGRNENTTVAGGVLYPGVNQRESPASTYENGRLNRSVSRVLM